MGGGILNSCESLDDMGFGGIRIIQKRDEFCYGVDAVLLADFAGRERREPEKIIDLGAGTGAVSLILSHKYPQAHIVETEIQKDSADRAARSAALNMLDDRIEVICGDIMELPDDMTKIILKLLITAHSVWFCALAQKPARKLRNLRKRRVQRLSRHQMIHLPLQDL